MRKILEINWMGEFMNGHITLLYYDGNQIFCLFEESFTKNQYNNNNSFSEYSKLMICEYVK